MVLFNKRFLHALVWLLVQQLIVASSTVLITQAAAAVSDPNRFVLFTCLYLLSLSLPYFPTIFSVRQLELGIYLALERYLERYFDRYYAKVSAWRNSETKSRTIPILTNEAENTIRQTTSILYDWISVALNVGFNILAVSYILSFRFLLGYLGAAALLLITYLLTNKKIAALSSQAQTSNIIRNDSLMNAWDNVLIGNRYNFKWFHQDFLAKFRRSQKQNVASIWLSQVVATLSSIACMAPVFGVLLWYIYDHIHQPVVLTEMMVTLPRQFQILNNFLVIASYISHWPAIRGRLQGIDSIFKAADDSESVITHIDWPSLQVKTVNGVQPLSSVEDFEKISRSFGPGRYLVTGKNGAGKSSLLILLKEHLKERAFFLPTNTKLDFKIDLKPWSTGQRMIKVFDELKDLEESDVLLLDEWDANLDHENASRVSKIVDSLSEKACVIEVRHFRRDDDGIK